MATKELRINEGIQVREVRMIDGDGNQRGIITTAEALSIAKSSKLDLVEVSPNANPPVCKLIDYGKYKFEQEKKKIGNQKRNRSKSS